MGSKEIFKIIVACHKPDQNIRKDSIYLPIQVGKALHPEIDLGFESDDSGDNISLKNPSYCELTAVYWAWKNLKKIKYIGLCHYRRYFDFDISISNIESVLKKYDAIAIKPKNTPYSAGMVLNSLLTREDFAIALDTLIKLYPDYKQSAIKYFFRNNLSSRYNMFIMKWINFDKYCNWLFPFLFELEKNLKPHTYTRLKRNLGYIAEAFMGLYFYHNKFKVKYVYTEDYKKLNPILEMGRIIRNNLMFALSIKPKNIKFEDSLFIGLKNDGINLNNLN